jgi:5-methylcytosine-specific restriction endonuclease McrA
MIDVLKKIQMLEEAEVMRKEEVNRPLNWETRYIVLPNEIPWWIVENCRERGILCSKQRMRAIFKENPEYSAAANRKHELMYPGYNIEAVRNHRVRHPESGIMATRKYYRTPRGKANRAKNITRRRKFSTNAALFISRLEQLHELYESCAKCGAQYEQSHEIDHIVALCLGGTDDWSNLQPLCIVCHRKKSAMDMRKLATLKRAGYNTLSPDLLRLQLLLQKHTGD